MISPFTIYLIMQLDAIRVAFIVMLAMGGFITGLLLIMWAFNCTESYSSEKRVVEFSKRSLPWVFPVFLLGLFGASLIPTSRTAAVMFIVPAIANNETVQREANELYLLAKQGLKDLVKPAKPAPQQ